VLYDLEMDNISKRFNPNTPNDPSLLSESIHLLNLYTFHTTTPSPRVRTYLEESFFSSSLTGTIPLLTNKGIRPSNKVRISPRSMSFLVDTPLLAS